MPRTISEQHQWVGAIIIDLPEHLARRGNNRGRMPIPAGLPPVDVLEVYCVMCKRPYDAVADKPCSSAESTEHLRGGPLGERKKRKHTHDCARVQCDQAPAEAVAATST
jgi:hypothetical protein